MEDKETRWWWVRHAPVPNSVRIYGQSDVDCDCSNLEVFKALAAELPSKAVWLTSNLSRTHQTAAAIVGALEEKARPKENPVAIPKFAEQNLGEWQGLVREEFFASRGRMGCCESRSSAWERRPAKKGIRLVIIGFGQ